MVGPGYMALVCNIPHQSIVFCRICFTYKRDATFSASTIRVFLLFQDDISQL